MQVFESILSSPQRGLGMNPEWIYGVAREKEHGLQSKVLLFTTYHLGDLGQVSQPPQICFFIFKKWKYIKNE